MGKINHLISTNSSNKTYHNITNAGPHNAVPNANVLSTADPPSRIKKKSPLNIQVSIAEVQEKLDRLRIQPEDFQQIVSTQADIRACVADLQQQYQAVTEPLQQKAQALLAQANGLFRKIQTPPHPD